MNTIPKAISDRWLNQQRTVLKVTVKEIGGEPNPSYVKLAAEIAEAEAEAGRRAEFVAWVKSELGAVLNQYPLRTPGKVYEPGTVFVKKDKATGKTESWTIEGAWKRFQAK